MSILADARGLYVIIDPTQTRGRDPRAVAEAALAGKPVALQLRAKTMQDGELVSLARELCAMARRSGVPFVLNDRTDLAILVGADAVHLGQDDMTIGDARRVIGTMPIGISTHSLTQAVAAERAGADHIGYGPIFPTQTKRDAEPVVGVEGLAEVVRAARIPVVAIGGITELRLPEIRATHARMAAAIGAVGLAADVTSVVRAMNLALGEDSR